MMQDSYDTGPQMIQAWNKRSRTTGQTTVFQKDLASTFYSNSLRT